MNLATAFATSVARQPDKVAVLFGDSGLTYSVLGRCVAAAAARLQSGFDLRPGDRVALWLKNRPEFVTALFGIWSAGGVAVPVNNFLKPHEVNYILSDGEIDLIITDEEMSVHLSTLASERPTLKVLKVEELPASPDQAPPFASGACESDLAVIIYTSGTTGRPKGAMLSHGNILSNVESCRQVLETIADDRFAVLLPMFHSYMLTVGICLPLIVGGSLVVIKSLNQPRQLLQELYSAKPTVLPAIPSLYRTLATALLPGPLPMRLCISGAAPLPVQILKDFEAKHGIPLIEGYGLSEASPVVAKNPIHGVRKPGSIGLPIPDVELSVQDDNGKSLGINEIGEICVRGGNVMQGYWRKPEETSRAFRNGWLLTGDVGYRDSDGYYFITDRKKDMLLVNGINVYPREIEEVLYQFAGVKEAAVIGVPDARKGEQPVAFVAGQDGLQLDEKAMLQFLKEKLADYKVPKRITLVQALPRNATGKILKTTLRETL